MNVFIGIVIEISPSYFHCNVFAISIPVHICFSLSTMSTFLMCYTTTLFSPIQIDLFQLSYNPWKNHISILIFHVYTSSYIPHSTLSLVAQSIAEPKYIVCFMIIYKISFLTFKVTCCLAPNFCFKKHLFLNQVNSFIF